MESSWVFSTLAVHDDGAIGGLKPAPKVEAVGRKQPPLQIGGVAVHPLRRIPKAHLTSEIRFHLLWPV